MSRTAIIAALADELAPLVRGWPRESRGDIALWRWRNAGDEWVAACAGVGVEAAGRAFAEVERDGPVDLVVSAGWAGALRGEFAAGRAYRVSGVVDAGTGERFSCPGPAGDCLLVTSQTIADPEAKRRLAAEHGAGLVDMEAAGVARLAVSRGVPFVCVKGVSDGPADRLPDFNRFISESGEFQKARFIFFAVLRPWLWPALVRLGENSRRAAQGIGESVREILGQRGGAARSDGHTGADSVGQ
jgi:adenosylhomocysteine nucleosidase